MRRSPALPALAATVVALVLAGCTGGSSSASADSDETGPLSAFFEKVGGSYEDEDYERQQREIEEIIAACMAEQGFEYTPAEPTGRGAVSSDDIPEWDSKEYAEQYGYGATTSEELYGSGDEWVDPNADYIASMSESEVAAFYEALYGAEPEIDETDPDAEYEYNWEEGGCSGKATHEVYEQGQIWDDPAFAEMSEEMGREYDNLADEPALRESSTKWTACMADAGYDFASPDEAQQSIYDELNALYEAAAPADPEAEMDPDASFEPDPAAMAELKTKELAVANADFACKESSGYLKAQKTAVLALEKRLWDKYGEQLEAIAAKQTPAK
ncbi:hypothetical protein [Cellulomonas phragmiteti]|uniref:Lipoprotein n=2 Tax=Cellulomonas phragmiteti TaxID=478780 RepID=A0ABQ4DJH6_9CELL|nr:hypothetical protein [Cellulomonas phragmiteti]GIG39142.1 hypothetical protein Cph01nite_09040 [Cellulomonas phragmiteti]